MASTGRLQLAKVNTAWLYATEILSRLVGLFIVPIWSSRVDPAEYARWILALTTVEMLLEVGGLGLGSFLTKVLYRYRDERAEQYFGMGASVMMGAAAVGAIALALLSPWLSRTVIGDGVRPDLFVFLGLYLLLAQLTRLVNLYLESRVQYAACFLLRTLRLVFYTGLLLFFLLARQQGFYSWVWAALGTELLLFPLSAYQLRRVRWRWLNRRMLTFALRFSLPSLATNFMGWGQSRAGRYVLSFAGLGAGVGLYGMAQNFSQNYGAVVRPTKLVSLRVLGHALEKDADTPYFLEFFHGFSCFALSVAFLVAMFLGDLMKLLVAPEYRGATAALPPLVFTLYFQEVYSLYNSLMFRYFKVWLHFWGTLIAFPTVMVSTVLLVPHLGFLGAAVAELAGGAAMLVFAHLYASNISPRQFRFGEKLIFTAAAFALAAVAEGLALSLGAKVVLAATALVPYLLSHWRRRQVLFPLAARATRSAVTKSSGLRRPVLVIERLELLTLPVWVWMAWRCRGGYFVGWARTLQPAWARRLLTRLTGLRQLRYEDFPGTYFEVQRVVAESANDALYEGARAAEAAPIVAFLRRFRNHELIEVALRKALQVVYTENRVKALVMLREVSRVNGEVIFVPRDNRDPRPWVPASVGEAWIRAAIPGMARAVNALKAWLELLRVAVSATLAVGYLAAQRGLAFTAPPRRHWRAGYDIFEEGIHWDKPYHEFFLYDDKGLIPQAVLHVVRDRLRDARTRQYFEEHGIPYVEDSRIPIPVDYFGRRILWQFWGGTLRLVFRQCVKGNDWLFVRAALRVLLSLIKAEVLETSYTTDVFAGRDEYALKHILRTLLYDERGGRTIGFCHGDDWLQTVANSYQCCHAFCFPGEFHRELLKENTRYSRTTCVIGAGLYGLDETYRRIQAGSIPERYAELRKRYRIVGAFASSFQPDFFITREMALRFYRTVLSLPGQYPDVVVVLRPKGSEFRDPEFRRLLADAGPRVILDEETWTYDLLPICDLMICIAISSVGLEGLMAGRRVIYFDESRFQEHPYAQYDPMLVARSPEELLTRVRRVLERDEYVDPNVLNHIRSYHGLAFDGKVVERLRSAIYSALGEVGTSP